MDFDLKRFIDAQAADFEIALSELAAGRKKTHWIWYVFPQLEGLGQSDNSKFYGIKGHDEARAYLDNAELFKNLDLALSAVYEQVIVSNVDVKDLMGSEIDRMKLFSSLELFSLMATEVDSVKYANFIFKANNILAKKPQNRGSNF